jgi:hypothetical protein
MTCDSIRLSSYTLGRVYPLVALVYKALEHHQKGPREFATRSALEDLETLCWRGRRRMEEIWILCQVLSIVLLGYGAVICLANAGLSDAAGARGDQAAVFPGDERLDIKIDSGQLPAPEGKA